MIITVLIDLPQGSGEIIGTAVVGGGLLLANRLVALFTEKKAKANLAEGVKTLNLKVDNIDSKIGKIEGDVKFCKSELMPNGGTSLKDMANKTHSTVVSMVSQQRLRLEETFNQSSENIFIMNELGEVTFSNTAITELFELSREHMAKRRWFTAIKDQAKKEEIIERLDFAIKRRLTFKMAVVISRKTMGDLPVVITVDPKLDDNGNIAWFMGKVKPEVL